MRTRPRPCEHENGYDLSISDLMAGLCGIFVLVVVAVVANLGTVRKEYQIKNAMAQEYKDLQKNLFDALSDEFSGDLDAWNAELDEKTLTFRFNDGEVLFDSDKYELKPKFKQILDDFFPRFVAILGQDEYRSDIDEIRIEGHTARDIKLSVEKDYTSGMDLSQKRVMNVLLYCLGTLRNDRKWVQENIAAIGYSNSRPKIRDAKVDWEASRRVEFRVKTKAEKILDSLADEEFRKRYE